MAVGLILAGCADDGRRFNPLSGLFAPQVEPPPANGRPFPNLATVPRPPEVTAPEGYQAAVQDLTGRRDDAILTDQALRAETPSRTIPARPSTPLPKVAAAPPARAAEPAERQQVAKRPTTLPATPQTLFVGTVMPEPDEALAEIQGKILKDAAEIAARTDGQIRLEGGATPADRERVAQSLTRLGVPPGHIRSGAPDDSGSAPRRPAIEIFVDY